MWLLAAIDTAISHSISISFLVHVKNVLSVQLNVQNVHVQKNIEIFTIENQGSRKFRSAYETAGSLKFNSFSPICFLCWCNLPIQITPSVLSIVAPLGDRIFTGSSVLSTWRIPTLRLRSIRILCHRPSSIRDYSNETLYLLLGMKFV